MRILLPVTAFLALAYFSSATFLATPAPMRAPAPQPRAVKPGEEPWKPNESITERGRDNARRSALTALGRPWSTFCSDTGRSDLIEALDYYYGQRWAQRLNYKTNWGEAGAAHIATAWSTANDNRIERLTRETYRNGYLNTARLSRGARETIDEVLSGERPASKPCTG